MQAQYKNYTYKVVKLQNLDRKTQRSTQHVDTTSLVEQLDKPSNSDEMMDKKNKKKLY